MAQSKITPREFIINTFSPQIAAVSSSYAENTCHKNNLSFIELLQPFCRISTEGQIKDPQGVVVTIRSLQLSIKDVNYTPPEPSVARKLLNDSVSSTYSDYTTCVKIGNMDLDIPVTVPWFELWRDTFLNVQYPSDHEFTKHFIACIIAVSTKDVNPLEKIQQIGAHLNLSIDGKLPKWFNNSTLRYHILIHDAIEDDKKKAEDIFSEMKNIYGSNNCFFLNMNSRPNNSTEDNAHLPDPWSQYITKQTDLNSNSGQGSSSHTPTDTVGVSSMPNSVSTEPERSVSQVATPLVPKDFPLSPVINENITIASEIPDVQNINLEVGQEAVSVSSTLTNIHPLSPESEIALAAKLNNMDILKSNSNLDSIPININVWADSPCQVTVQHGTRLSSDDLERLKIMISEFYLKSLLPYVEKQLSVLNDIVSNKKGVSRTLFSATKRWFGSSKPGVAGSVPVNSIIYAQDSPELQLRRLADLCFMFGHYTLAYQAYHNAKRDFSVDQAWLYYAGALEMAALSAFMMDEMIKKTIEYMDESTTTYLNTCKMPQFATRATLLGAECLKNRGLYGEAAKQLIRMTSEDSDLRSALLLEQAAYCFISPKMVRKYAFHIVLAGHRFSKAGQKKHSLRCYKQAYQVYKNKGWSLAEDHIHFTIGRQAASLKQLQEAVKIFEKLLNDSSKQPALQQAAFLREYLYIYNLLVNETKEPLKEIHVLPLPLIEDNEIKVLLGPVLRAGNNIELTSQILSFSQDADDIRWSKLEEIILSKVHGTPPMIFKPTVTIYTNSSNNLAKPNTVVNEIIYFCINLSNPLLIPLPLSNIKLIWSFEDEDNNVITNEIEDLDVFNNLVIESIVIQPVSKETIVLSIMPNRIGQLKVIGLSYNLSNPVQPNDQTVSNFAFVKGKRLFSIKAQRLKNVKEKPGVASYGPDLRLHMNIVKEAPFLQVSFSNISREILCGELQKMELILTNIGSAPLKNIYLGSTNPKLFVLMNHKQNFEKGQSKKRDELVIKIYLPPEKNDILLVNDSIKLTLWVCAPYKKGNERLDLLFYYENMDAKSIPKYRLSRHSWHLTILDSIQANSIVRRSLKSKNDFSVLNLVVDIKNSNQAQDPFMNEIEISEVSLQSNFWDLIKNENIVNTKMQPQEMIHFLFNLYKNEKINKTFSEVILSKSADSNFNDIPYIDFIQRRHIIPLGCDDNQTDNQQLMDLSGESALIDSTMKVQSTLILKWRAKIMEGGKIIRNAVGQQYLDIDYLNKFYKNYSAKSQTEPLEHFKILKIFGPDISVSDTQKLGNKEHYSILDSKKNIVWFSIGHCKEVAHNFTKNRICIVPVVVNLQNNSLLPVDVKLLTVGTSSQTQLPNIRTQLYSPQASSNFRFVGQSSSVLQLEAHCVCKVNLNAAISATGTHDLSSRIEVFAKVQSESAYTLQKWKIDSVCIVRDCQ